MERSELDLLLEKYYRGETTSLEEARIRVLLEDNNLPSTYISEKEMFSAFTSGESIPEPSERFMDNILERIDAVEDRSRITGVKRKLYSAVAVAASLLVMISSYFIFSANQKPGDTFSDPELAYLKTMEVLYIVSEGLNSGSNSLSDLAYIESATEDMKVLSNANASVAKHLETLGYFEKGLKLVDEKVTGKK